jgi:hypothetical protein
MQITHFAHSAANSRTPRLRGGGELARELQPRHADHRSRPPPTPGAAELEAVVGSGTADMAKDRIFRRQARGRGGVSGSCLAGCDSKQLPLVGYAFQLMAPSVFEDESGASRKVTRGSAYQHFARTG